MKKLVLLIGLIAPIGAFSQATIYMNATSGNVYIVEASKQNAPIYLEINNPLPTAIAQNVSPGYNSWIVSEAEGSKVKWDIGNAPAAAYVVPFGGSLVPLWPSGWNSNAYPYYLPVTFNIGTAGSAGGSMIFATWKTDPDNGNGYTYVASPYHLYPDFVPTDVTNMASSYSHGSPLNADNSYNVVDRFWTVDATSAENPNPYVTAPSAGGPVGIQFSYISGGRANEWAGPNNAVNPSNIVAQRFNSSISAIGSWGDWMGPAGTNLTSGNVTTINTGLVSPANLYRSWTLSNDIEPLPIVLKSEPTVQCVNGDAVISWTSETEINNKFYTIAKSQDGTHWVTAGTVTGAGNSSSPISYSYTDNSPFSGVSYYMLSQTNYDGTPTELSEVPFNGCGATIPATTTVSAFNAGPYIDVQIDAAIAGNYDISLVNMLGQSIYSTTRAAAPGYNEYRLDNSVAAGIYLVNVRSAQTSYTQKIVLGVK